MGALPIVLLYQRFPGLEATLPAQRSEFRILGLSRSVHHYSPVWLTL